MVPAAGATADSAGAPALSLAAQENDTVNVTGNVTRGDDPAANDHLHLRGENDSWHGTLDEQGAFEATVAANDSYHIGYDNGVPQFDGYADIYVFEPIAVDDTAQDVALDVPAGHHLNITVTDEFGTPIEGARVSVMAENDGYGFGSRYETTAAGEFHVDGAAHPGIEVVDDVRVVVRPPTDDDRFNERVEREMTITEDTNMTVALERDWIDYEPVEPALGEEVTFNASTVDGGSAEYEWTFPDGTTKTGDVVTHAFDTVDGHEVQLTVTTENGTYTATETVPVGGYVPIQHSESRSGTRGTNDLYADRLIVETSADEDTFDIGGDAATALRVVDTDTGETVTVTPVANSTRYTVDGAALDIYRGTGELRDEPQIRAYPHDVTGTEWLDVAVDGDTEMFTNGTFANYTVELVETETEQTFGTTDARLTGVGYEGWINQTGNEGEIELTVPRDDEVDETWDVVLEMRDPDDYGLVAEQEFTHHPDTNELSLTLNATDLEDGVYDTSVIFYEDAGEEPHILRGFGRDRLIVGNYTLDPSIDAPAKADVDALVEFNASVAEPEYIERYEWEFSNGGVWTTTYPSVERNFSTAGEYEVDLTVHAYDGQTETTSTTITVGETIDITGELELASGDPAANATVVIFDEYEELAHVQTAADGTFAATLPERNATYNLQYYQATNTDGESTVFPRDGHVDVYAVTAFNGTAGGDLGSFSLPTGHAVNVSVVDEDGQPVEDAWVYAAHDNDEVGARAGWGDQTTADGVIVDAAGTPGLELNGTVEIGARPPEESNLDQEWVVETITVTEPREPELVLDAGPPAVALDVTPTEENYTAMSAANPAVIEAAATDAQHETTVVEVRNATGNTVRTWNISADTGDGQTHTLEWPAFDGDSTVASGEYEVTVRSTDAAGNANETTENVTVDTDKPAVAVTDVAGGIADGDVVHTNESDNLTVSVDADDGTANADAVEAVAVTLDAEFTTYELTVDAEQENATRWTATIPAATLPEDGTYAVRATATDTAKNTANTTAAESIAHDTTAPAFSAVVDLDEQSNTGNVTIRSTDALAEAPSVEIVGPDNTTEAVAVTESGSDRWTGSFDASADGTYHVTATATDPAGNTGNETAVATIERVSTTNRTVTVVNEETGTFIQFNTTDDVENTVVTVAENEVPPAALSDERIGVGFLTSELGETLDTSLETATINIPVDEDALPDGVAVDDATITYFNESAGEWEDVPTTVVDVEADGEAETPAGRYWQADVDSFSTYGVTATDEEAPVLVDASPAADTQVDWDTDSVAVDFAYEDALSGVNVSSVAVAVNGDDVTTDAATTITSGHTTYEFAVEPDAHAGDSHTVEVTVADDAGNAETFTRTFTVAEPPAPSITDSTPAGKTYAATTERVDIRFEYDTPGLPINESASALTIHDDSGTEIPSETPTWGTNAVTTTVPVANDTAYTVDLSLEDEWGHERTQSIDFAIDAPDEGGDGTTAPSPAPLPEEEPAVFALDAVATPTDVVPGEAFSLDMAVENVGEETDAADVTLLIAGEPVDSTSVSLVADDKKQVTLTGTAPEETDEVDVTVETPDDTYTVTLTVADEGADEQESAEPKDDEEPEDGESADESAEQSDEPEPAEQEDEEELEEADDGTPGFGIVPALLATLSAAYAIRRRGT